MLNKKQIKFAKTTLISDLVLNGEEFDFAKLIDNGLTSEDCIGCDLIRSQVLIEKNLRLFEDKSVLELGPNMGIFSKALSKVARHLTVVENNPESVKHLRNILPKNVTIIHADFHHHLWTFSPGDFDII